MFTKCCGVAVAGLCLVSVTVFAQAPGGTSPETKKTTTVGTPQPGAAKGTAGTPAPGTAPVPGGVAAPAGFPGRRGFGGGFPAAQGQGRTVADLLERLNQIKKQRAALEKEETEILARLKTELPRQHQALEEAERLLKEYEGTTPEKSGVRSTRSGSSERGSSSDARGNALFNRYAQGKDHIVIDQVQNPRDPLMKTRLTQFAQREGITNGRLTRDQFAKFMQGETAGRRTNGQVVPATTIPTKQRNPERK
jgi:hypothetical protein